MTHRSVLLVDLDGTLTDPAEGIVGCFRFALEALGRTAPPAAGLTWIIGPPLRRSFADLLDGAADPEKALAIYRSCYSKEGLFEAVVYGGVPEALAALKGAGVRLILCTAKPHVYATRILQHFDLECYFEAAYGAELDGRFEDKGDLIAHILGERGLDAGDCVMWGDRQHDVIAARRHAIPTIGALWGYGGEPELRLAGADALCAQPSEVPDAFQLFPRAGASSRSRRMVDDASKHVQWPQPPRAEIRPSTHSAHGLTWDDGYAWIRAGNWRDVLRDPSRLPDDIRALLEAENAYAAALLAPTADLQKELVREMRARLKEDDSEPPQVDGPYAYYSRYRPGGQHRFYCRLPREGGDEIVLIDGDARAKGLAFFHVASAAHSPDHAKFAWSADDLGSEILTIRVRDIERGEDLADRVINATGDIVWTRDSTAFLYVEQDEDHRPFRVMLHRLGTPQGDDVEVFAEPDPAWFIGVQPTRLGRSALVSVHGHDGSETHVVDLDAPAAKPMLVAPRRSGLFYDVMDHGDCFYIRTNATARDFKIVVAPREAPGEENWRDVVPHRDGRFIADASLFKNHLVVLTREESRPRLEVHDLRTGAAHDIVFGEETYALDFETVYEFDTTRLRFSYSAMNRPAETYDYDCATRERSLAKQQMTPPGFDPAAYVVRLVFARADDGQRVPVSLLMRRDRELDGTAPLLLTGYGAYGYPYEASFATNRLSLVDRGFVYAIAHVRGGTDKGWGWYEDGKLQKKPNTFTDFIAVARHLIGEGYTGKGRIVAQSGSAGGLLMGVIANMAPDLFAGIIADVPFVDALSTILDETLPLTPPEWLEWGDPIRDKSAFDVIRSYSPYDNVRAQAYPAILALAGLTDPRVTYWEPAKWVARLRATMIGGGPILLVTAMEAGHGGQPGRFDRLEEVARNFAFAIACVSGGLASSEVS
jgi:oligopeptidase B